MGPGAEPPRGAVSGRPSWAAGPAVSAPAHSTSDSGVRPPLTLVIGMVIVAVLAVAEAVHVAGRDDLRAALRVGLVIGVAFQIPCAALALRRSSTAVMVLLLCAITAFVAAVANGAVLAAVGAVAVIVLVSLSLRWFPTAEPWSS